MTISMAYEPGNYFLKRSGSVIAYVRFTATGCFLTPNKISGADLAIVHKALDENLELPEDLKLVPMKVSTIPAQSERPQWSEMIVSSSKRQKWLERRKLSVAS